MGSQITVTTHDYTDIILEHIPVGVALYDAQEFRLLAANTLYHKFLNQYVTPSLRNGRALGLPLKDWLPQEEVIDFLKIFRTVAETGTPYQAEEYTFHSPECGISYWNWSLAPLRNNEGQISQLLVTASNVTAQVLARQQVEQARISLSSENRAIETERKRLEVIETVARSVRESLDIKSIASEAINAIASSFNTTRVGIYIADQEQQSLQLLATLPLLNTEQAQQFYQRISYNRSLLLAQAHKRRDPIILEDMQSAASSGTIDRSNPGVALGIRGYICMPLWFKDYFEGTLIASFSNPIAADGPEVQTLQGCSTHIAAALAYARLHTAVENEHARLRTVLDQLPEGVVIIEASDGHVSYANATASSILGIPLKQLIDAPLNRYPQAHLVANLDGKLILPWNFTVIHALCGETISSQETMVVKPDGSNVVTLSSAMPIRTESGVITGAATVFQDITAQKSIEQQKNEFLSIASHELRTPVTAILGYAEILQLKASQGQSLDAISLQAVARINEQSECLKRLIDELLDLSRLEHDQTLINPNRYDLLKTVREVKESQASTTKRHHLRLVLDGLSPDDTLMGYFDVERMTQVLNNLIGNAIKYSPAGGEIEVGLRHTREHPDEALIWVKDSGIGIPADELPDIFKRFHRASNVGGSFEGLGIGLYLVSELVKRHHGRVWAENVEGGGSIFYVLLPLNSLHNRKENV